MEGKLILNQQIIDKVKAKSAGGVRGFTHRKLANGLLDFIGKNKALVGKDICEDFDTFYFSDLTTLRRALDRKGRDAGAMPGLRDLLCYYAFGKSWERTITEVLELTIEGEVEENNRIKNINPTSLEDHIKTGFEQTMLGFGDLKNSLEIQLGSIAELIRRASIKTDAEQSEYAKSIEIYCKCAEAEDWDGMREPLEVMTISMDKTIGELIDQQSFFLTQLLVQLNEMHQYSEAIAVSERIANFRPLNSIQNLLTACAYYGLKDHQNVFLYTSKILEVEPYEARCFEMQIISYYQLKDYPNMAIESERVLKLFSEQKLYYLNWTVSKDTFKINHEKCPLDEGFYGQILRYHIHALHESNAPDFEIINSIDKLPAGEDDILYAKLKVRLLAKNPFQFILYCKACIKKYPKESFFMLHLTAVLVQTKQPKKDILKQVKQLCKLNDDQVKTALKTDKAFDALWGDPDFIKIVDTDFSKPGTWKFW